MMTSTRIAFFYILFAAIATIANIGTQFTIFRIETDGIAVPVAMIAGTGVGLILKYMLDKTWIFDDRETGLEQHARKFSRYSLIGVGTTAVFWFTELAFTMIGTWEGWRYIGAIIGLTIGYTIKYFADRKFVFARTR